MFKTGKVKCELQDILIPLHPKWWEQMISGKKTLECRTRIPQICTGRFWVCLTGKDSPGVVGCFKSKVGEYGALHFDVVRASSLHNYDGIGEISKSEIYDIFRKPTKSHSRGPLGDDPIVYMFSVQDVSVMDIWSPGVSLQKFAGIKRTPQSWVYLSPRACAWCGEKIELFEEIETLDFIEGFDYLGSGEGEEKSEPVHRECFEAHSRDNREFWGPGTETRGKCSADMEEL